MRSKHRPAGGTKDTWGSGAFRVSTPATEWQVAHGTGDEGQGEGGAMCADERGVQGRGGGGEVAGGRGGGG